MRQVARQALIVAIALILGIGQACACLSHAGMGDQAAHPSHETHASAHAPQENHQPAVHDAAHDGHAGPDDPAGRQPCDESCPHCADSFAAALQGDTGAFTVPAPAAKAVLANGLADAFADPFSLPRHYLALNWLDPPGDTPVSLNSVMRV